MSFISKGKGLNKGRRGSNRNGMISHVSATTYHDWKSILRSQLRQHHTEVGRVSDQRSVNLSLFIWKFDFKSKEWRRSAARILSNHPELSTTWGLMNTVFQRKQVEINQCLLSIESFVKTISKTPSSSIIDKILIYGYTSCIQISQKLSPWEEKSHSY